MDPIEFWDAHHGRLLCPHAPGDPDPVATALTRNYRLASKPAEARLGSIKSASLVRPGASVLMADIRVDHPTPGLTIMPPDWRTVPNWKAEVITDPPEPPFMFIEYGKAGGIECTFRLNLTRDVVEISGVERLSCRPAVVRAALDAIGDTPATVWRKAAFLDDRRTRDQSAAARIDEQLDALRAKYPNLDDLLDALPPFRSDDYDATAMVHAVRAKEAASAARTAA